MVKGFFKFKELTENYRRHIPTQVRMQEKYYKLQETIFEKYKRHKWKEIEDLRKSN